MNLSLPGQGVGLGPKELLFANFNQDNSCFACGTVNGFAVFNTVPFRETFRRIFSSGGIGIVEMLFRCNLLALVGGGRNPRYPPNKVMIWDDYQNKCVGELMFKTHVYAVRLRRDHIVVVLENKVYIYRFKDLKLLVQIPTCSNTKGLIALCSELKHIVLAIPGTTKGSVRVELFDIRKNITIQCHSSDLAQIALSRDGKFLATASDKGTLIRLWNPNDGSALRELRRGSDRADVYCLTFSPKNTYLACTSDKGTAHIFSLAEKDLLQNPRDSPRLPSNSGSGSSVGRGGSPVEGENGSNNHRNNAMKGVGLLQKVLPGSAMPKYFQSEWSYAQLRGLEGKERTICAFDASETHISVVSADGLYTYAHFAKGGEAVRVLVSSALSPYGGDEAAGTGTEEGGPAGTRSTMGASDMWAHPEVSLAHSSTPAAPEAV